MNLQEGYYDEHFSRLHPGTSLTGIGFYVYANRDIYEGEFVNNLFEGMGKLTMRDYVFNGNFHKDKFDGEGILSIPSINWSVTGIWKNNVYMRKIV